MRPPRSPRVSLTLSPGDLAEQASRCQRERQRRPRHASVHPEGREPITPLQPLPFEQRPVEFKKDIRRVEQFTLPVYFEPWKGHRLRPRGGFEDPQQPGVWYFGNPEVKPAPNELRLIQVRDSIGTVWIVWSRSNQV